MNASDSTALSPVAPRERVATLDVLRGFALLGVLIANVLWLFSARQFERHADTRGIDRAATLLATVFVHGKAQTLLTFLFGFGFAAQLLRAQQRHEPVLGLYLRRLAVLFTIGLLHVTLLWWGDVTWHYAIAGFALLLFLHTSDRTRIAWAALLTFIPGVVVWGLPPVRSLVLNKESFTVQVHQLLTGIHGQTYRAMMSTHVRFALAYVAPTVLSYFPWLVGRFLLGFVAGTQRWFDDDGAQHLTLFRKLLGYGLLCGLLSAIVQVVAPPGLDRLSHGFAASLTITALEQLGTLGLTAAYVAVVVLLMQDCRWRRLLSIVAPAGRMPLTTYISQSLICTFLFYAWGLGWAGRVTAAECLALAVLIFSLQVLTCHLWLRRLRFGPLEWLWRTLVYMRRQPMAV